MKHRMKLSRREPRLLLSGWHRPRSDDDVDYMGGRTNITVFDTPTKAPEFTGLVTEHEEPICRFFMPKPGVGFLAEAISYYEPGAYAYGLHPISFDPMGTEYEEEEEVEQDDENEDDGVVEE